ncbi:hypothetical protein DFH08DRAFT_985980 [Mycena albidolilacea]|uniref:Uncharacterized protein n=1 Tax=Mycena albidolilacea TaxID=1033008 RepID=A0AAD7E937_9AGAR|nr:hypothetical protein DFH08DRAFT_985980 [Mycena albidolilacea]
MPTNAKATCSLRSNKPNRRVCTLVGGTIKTLGPAAQQQLHHHTNQAVIDEMNGPQQCPRSDSLKFVALQTGEGFSEGTDGGDFEDQAMDIDDVLRGDVQFDISNAGGEFEEEDTRNRKDKVLRCVLGFRRQMKAITSAYVKWGATQDEYGADPLGTPPPAGNTQDGWYCVKVVDLFKTYIVSVPLQATDEFIVSSLVGQGLFPCSPFAPKVAVATRVLEMFRVNRLRCPTLSVQSWVKSLCDLHGRPYVPYLTQQFSICFDLYLETLANVDKCVVAELKRDAPDWCLKNCCHACTYKLEEEMKLIFAMLTAMDGKDSLKRVLCKDKTFDEEGNPTQGQSQRPDPRTEEAGGDYWWSKEVIESLVDIPHIDDPEEQTVCEERWKNLKEDMTSQMWGIFDETGVFLALCRHGFVLLLADMVRSGELAKYLLAIVDALLDAFGPNIRGGYDIGCGFGKTINKSPLGKKAQTNSFSSLSWPHMCPGMGLEDLEGCERFFSKSNSPGEVDTIRKHVPPKADYHNLPRSYRCVRHCTFLVNNYKQAIEILDTEEPTLAAIKESGIQDVSEFQSRLQEEMEYLRGLSKEPDEETDRLEYYRRLVALMEREAKFNTVCGEGSKSRGPAKRHAREGYERALADVEAKSSWEWESTEWLEAEELANTRKYRKCINQLEALVLKRMFELTKMNLSGTGYKMRKHIAKALQARSQAIRNALKRYNAAASALDRRTLSWPEVIDYTFLSEWDLLRDPDGNARLRPWAIPAARILLDAYFKIERAKEEIDRLNVEIKRFVTYIRDEKVFLDGKVIEVEARDPHLAFFVREYQSRRGRFDEGHIKKSTEMASKLGGRFTGSLSPGIRLAPPVAETENMDVSEGFQAVEEEEESWELETLDADDDDEDEGEEAEEEELAEILETVLTLATDGVALQRGDE